MDDLSPLLGQWPVAHAAAGVTDATEVRARGGDPSWQAPIASVTKLLVGMAALVAIEEEAITLDEPAGPEGATVRHLIAHAAGYAFDEDRVLAAPGARRTYSNIGIERFAEHLAARTDIPFAEYLQQAVIAPLGLTGTELRGSPAQGMVSTVEDLLRFGRELLRPTLVAPETLAAATSPQFPDLPGVVPGIGRFDPNPWGLTFEIRGDKDPHWTGTRNSPQTYGHFGGSGTFLWVDPQVGLACAVLTDRRFGPWALEAWPRFNDEVLTRFG